MYVRYGIYRSFRLAWNDCVEARSQLSTAPLSSPTHGTRQQRLDAFDLDYSRYSVESCVYAHL